MNELAKRDDAIYKEIEEFKDYELTYCIAYEMAIRNDEVKELLNILKEREMDSSISIKHLKKLIKYGVNSRSPKKANYKYSIEYEIAGRLVGTQSDKNAIWKRVDSDEKIINTLFPIDKKVKIGLSRPQLEFKNSKVAAVDINFSLPKKELLAYVEKIKDDFDKDFSMIKTPIELLEEEIQKADNLVCDEKGKCFDPRLILTKQQKMADMFYIYDCLKVGISRQKIRSKIYNYYADLGTETITMDYKTMKRYKEIAKAYIDNLKYKEMITGIQNK